MKFKYVFKDGSMLIEDNSNNILIKLIYKINNITISTIILRLDDAKYLFKVLTNISKGRITNCKLNALVIIDMDCNYHENVKLKFDTYMVNNEIIYEFYIEDKNDKFIVLDKEKSNW